MMQAILSVAAVVAGILVGVWIRSRFAQSEKSHLDQRNRESLDVATALRSELAMAQGEATRRAGFEALAAERERTIAALVAERDSVRWDLGAGHANAREQAARISQLEAELNNERQNMTEKVALLESAKQALANQFEALAAEVLEKKARTFSEGSQKELGTLL